MRLVLLLVLLSASPALADLSQRNPPTTAEVMANTARFRACFRGYGPIHYRITVKVTTGENGMIIGDPEVVAPVDDDEFRREVESVLKAVRRCEPFKYYPPEKFAGIKTQPFVFEPNRSPDPDIKDAVNRHFNACMPPRQTGPDVVLYLHYKHDGTFAVAPRVLDMRETVDYLRGAADVLEAALKCPPIDLPQDKYRQWEKFRRRFESVEGDKDATTPKPDVIER